LVGYLTYAVILILASLNRETSAFLVLAYALVAWRCNRLNGRFLALLTAIWLTVFIGLRLTLNAPSEGTYGLPYIVAENLERLPGGFVYLVLFIGGVGFTSVLGWRYAPPFVRALLPMVVAYVGAILVFGIWGEVRLWLPIVPLLLVMAWGAVKRLAD
jgi:hypothetical protein